MNVVGIFTYLKILFLLMPVVLSAQNDLILSELSGPDTLKADKDSIEQIVTSPVADPAMYYHSNADVYRIQSGLYLGRRHIGIESTYFSPGSDLFVDLFLGVANYRDLGSPSSAVWIGGLSAGRDFLLNNRDRIMEENKTDLYFRIAPGVGMAGRGIFDSRETDYFLGLQTKILVGAQYNFSTNTSLYVNGGGRLLWFPALEEIRFTGIPLVSIGLQFSSSPQIPMVRF